MNTSTCTRRNGTVKSQTHNRILMTKSPRMGPEICCCKNNCVSSEQSSCGGHGALPWACTTPAPRVQQMVTRRPDTKHQLTVLSLEITLHVTSRLMTSQPRHTYQHRILPNADLADCYHLLNPVLVLNTSTEGGVVVYSAIVKQLQRRVHTLLRQPMCTSEPVVNKTGSIKNLYGGRAKMIMPST